MGVQTERSGGEATLTTWRAQVRGARAFPRRFLCNVADFSRPLWWATAFAVPAVLLAVGVVGGGGLVYFYTMYSAVVLMALFQTSERFADTSVELDPAAGELGVTYHMGDPSLFRGGREVTVSLGEVGSARFLSVGDGTMVRLHHGKPFAGGTAFLVPPESERRLRDALREHGVAIRDETGAGVPGWVMSRGVVTALLLGVMPVAAVFVWPVYYSWATVLVLVLNGAFLLRQGP